MCFLVLVSKVSQPTVTEEKQKDSDLLDAEYISLSVDTVYSTFLYRRGPGHDLSTRHLAGQDTKSLPEWKSSHSSAETLRTCFCPLFYVTLMYSWKREKPRTEKKKTVWEEEAGSSCPWEVVAVFLCTLYSICDVIFFNVALILKARIMSACAFFSSRLKPRIKSFTAQLHRWHLDSERRNKVKVVQMQAVRERKNGKEQKSQNHQNYSRVWLHLIWT